MAIDPASQTSSAFITIFYMERGVIIFPNRIIMRTTENFCVSVIPYGIVAVFFVIDIGAIGIFSRFNF